RPVGGPRERYAPRCALSTPRPECPPVAFRLSALQPLRQPPKPIFRKRAMDRLESIANAQPFTRTYRIEALDGSGRSWGKGEDVVQPSASTRKVGIMMHALGAARAGRIDLSKKLTITAALQEGINSGT